MSCSKKFFIFRYPLWLFEYYLKNIKCQTGTKGKTMNLTQRIKENNFNKEIMLWDSEHEWEMTWPGRVKEGHFCQNINKF